MPGAAIPRGRKLILLCVLATVLIGGTWWWQRPPPVPVHDGKRLSDYLVHFPQRTGNVFVSSDKIKVYGPEGVAWLAYMAEHGKPRFIKKGPLPLDNAPDWLRRAAPDRWGGLRVPVVEDERAGAMEMLYRFGPDAAPAIPVLVRCLERGDPNLRLYAAQALQAIGPASWPVARDLLEHGNPEVRAELLCMMWARPEKGGGTEEAVMASAVAALIEALDDPTFEIRQAAAECIGHDLMQRKDSTRYNAAIPILFRILSDREHRQPPQVAWALSSFGDKAAMAIPRLIELLDDPNAMVRINAAMCLPAVDKTGEHCAAALRKMFHDKDPSCRTAAASALGELGLSPQEETSNEKKTPAQ